MSSALLSCCGSENKNASAPNRGEGIECVRGTTLFAPTVPAFARYRRWLRRQHLNVHAVRLVVSSLPALVSTKIQNGTTDLITPLTREDGSDYWFHRNGSKASSSSVLTGSHHPPALWKARNDYYSSSQPLLISAILEKSNR
jgi:hypothetical protein